MATNSPSHKRRIVRSDAVETLAQRLASATGDAPVPLLVLRLPDLERIAWREGRRAARRVETRAHQAFVDAAAATLRTTDVLAHGIESEYFLVGLSTRTREGASVAVTTDCRAMLARLGAAMERACGLRIESGWTAVRDGASEDARAAAIEAALERGARERERYAFFSTIGHELRTPLTSIRGYLETLLDDDLDPVKARRFTETALAETLRMKRLVDGMFDVSVMDLRAGSAQDERCNARTAVDAACAAAAPSARERGVTVSAAPGADVALPIAHDRLVQIVVNLLENAIKHGRVDGRVEVAFAALDARFVELRVDDDGPGVAPEEREAIFALAHRGARAGGPGTGIGLAVVRLLVERIGGESDVERSPLGGARFRVRLPIAPGG